MSPPRGIVYLVGAGPGDPRLITVRGRELLRSADVVVHDRLIGAELLLLARREAEIIDVGKSPGAPRAAQDEIHELLVNRARRGLCVVRLKGGDPFVFGRGYEEFEACRRAGVECVVVPGISSALAAPLAAGIPLTARGLAQSVAIVTAQTADDQPADFAAVAKLDTVVILMGRAKLASVARALLEAGKNPDTPAACIEQATLPGQQVVRATLGTLVEAVERAGLSAPMVTVVGETAALDATSEQGAGSSLSGKRVVVTRPRSSSRELQFRLTAAGANVICAPMIRIVYPPPSATLQAALANLNRYSWIAFTSMHGVRGFWKSLRAANLDARALAPCRLAAVGPTTARALARFGVQAHLVAATHSAAGLAETLVSQAGLAVRRVLLPQGDLALRSPAKALREAGIETDEVVVYRTLGATPPRVTHAAIEGGVDAILFFSPSAVARFVELGLPPGDAVIACIGPTTASKAAQLGLGPQVVAEDHSSEGLVRALEEYMRAVEVGA